MGQRSYDLRQEGCLPIVGQVLEVKASRLAWPRYSRLEIQHRAGGSVSATLYKEFRLRNGGAWSAIIAFVKANAQSFIESGTPLLVIFTTEDRRRTADQNRMYWGGILKYIAEQAWINGRQFDKDTWHEFLARKFGVCEDVTLPDGEIIIRRKSTSQMSVHEFSEYINQVQAYATSELGVELV